MPQRDVPAWPERVRLSCSGLKNLYGKSATATTGRMRMMTVPEVTRRVVMFSKLVDYILIVLYRKFLNLKNFFRSWGSCLMSPLTAFR